MVPPAEMLVTKNRATVKGLILLALTALLAGCMPPGPRALLDGKKLLDQGRYPQAVEKLKLATSLLGTNAQAWNYLGLAYHRTDQPAKAVAAYRKALALNQNLAEAHFNLGCLWLEQNKFDAAREEFTTYTMQRGHAVEGFLKLGLTHYRARAATAAAEDFQKALRLSPRNPEALNGLGLIQLQRNRPREAAQLFSEALQQQPNYRPALLNLATVSHRYLNDAPGALRKYREYLALKPRPADWDAVNAAAQALELQLAPPPKPAAVAIPAQPVVSANPPKPTPIARVTPPPKAEPEPVPVKTSPPPSAPVTVVKLPPEPIIKTVPDTSTSTGVIPSETVAMETNISSWPLAAKPPPPPKRSFFSWLNPFRRKAAKPPKTATPSPPIVAESPPALTAPAAVAAADSPPLTYERYTYLSPPKPAAGDREAADRAFAQGVQSQQAKRLAEAAAAFGQAVHLDPRYFEAQYNLGLVAYEMRNYRSSLAAWEMALAIRPDSTDARYNFALALKAAKYPLDAVNELEKIVAAAPDEARAQLVLGILYAGPLDSPAKARLHYQRVLELDPRNPQAATIRYWLAANPP